MFRVWNGSGYGKNQNNSFGSAYDGSKQMGDLAGMPLFSSDPNQIVNQTYNLLSERSTTLFHTYGAVKSAIKKQMEYGIGSGLVFRSQPAYNILNITRESARDWGKEFQKIVHFYMDMFNFYEKQSKLFTTSLYAGDSWLFYERKKGLLTDIIDTSNNQIWTDYDTENYTLGIKHDDMLRRQGIIKTDGTKLNFRDSQGNQNVSQFALCDISRQLRGMPLAYSIINLARNDDTFSDAITHKAVLDATYFAIFKGNGTDFNKQASNLANKNNASKTGVVEKTLNKFGVTRMGAGNIVTMNNTEDFEVLDSKTPGNNYDPFKKWGLNYVAMGTGTPPEVILSKYESSFTAHKGALNDFTKSFTKKRKSFERNIMDSVVRAIAIDAISQGFIKAPGFFDSPVIQHAYLQGMYLSPVPGYINPLVEVKAQALAVQNAFKLRSDVALQMGESEYDDFLEEWKQEQTEFTNTPDKYQGQKIFNKEVEND
jgi:capsid protein